MGKKVPPTTRTQPLRISRKTHQSTPNVETCRFQKNWFSSDGGRASHDSKGHNTQKCLSRNTIFYQIASRKRSRAKTLSVFIALTLRMSLPGPHKKSEHPPFGIPRVRITRKCFFLKHRFFTNGLLVRDIDARPRAFKSPCSGAYFCHDSQKCLSTCPLELQEPRSPNMIF